MKKLFGTLHRWAMKLAETLRPLVDHITDRVERNSPVLRQKLGDGLQSFRSNGTVRGAAAYEWRSKFWAPLASWLTVVTWKRFIVVGILVLIVGGIATSFLDSVFTRKEQVTVHSGEEAKQPHKSKTRSVKVGTSGVVVVDQDAGKTVTVSFEGITVQSRDPDGDGSKTAEKPVEVSASGVVFTDPETGQRYRLGPQGVVLVEAAASAASMPNPTPNPAPVPVAAPQPPQPPSKPATSASASGEVTTVQAEAVKIVKNADGSRTVVAGPFKIRLQKGATEDEIAEVERSLREAWDEMQAAAKEAKAEVKAEIDAAKAAADAARQEAEQLRNEHEELEQAREGNVQKSTRVITVNRPAGVGDVLMPLLTLLLFAAVLAKVLLNTRSKAAAKVAAAQQETEREALERQLVEAKLTTMQAQVEPHFLFNTLGSVEYLIESDPKRAAEMQRSLIAYLRAAMPHMRESTSNMGREAQLIQSYLEILQFRMEERLEFSVLVPVGLQSAEFPPMMLLSLVENSIKHGLEPKPDGGRVDVLAEIIDGRLRVTVADTGLGCKPDGASTSGTRVGLANIRERLAVLYKGAAKLEITANAPSGTRVVIELPYKVNSKL